MCDANCFKSTKTISILSIRVSINNGRRNNRRRNKLGSKSMFIIYKTWRLLWNLEPYKTSESRFWSKSPAWLTGRKLSVITVNYQMDRLKKIWFFIASLCEYTGLLSIFPLNVLQENTLGAFWYRLQFNYQSVVFKQI